jgi:long-subunit acyl-CoA synthetase (AMP-forming)
MQRGDQSSLLFPGYGMTELTFGCHMWDIGTPFNSVGKLFPNLEQMVCDKINEFVIIS